MILPDLNLLVHAYNSDSPRHQTARAWWEGAMNGAAPLGLAWAVILGYVRITTHPTILERPLTVKVASLAKGLNQTA